MSTSLSSATSSEAPTNNADDFVYDRLPQQGKTNADYTDACDPQYDRDHYTIRVLELRSGHTDEEIHIELVEVCLRDNPAFEALSYCWGSSTSEKAIKCNNKTILIGETLFQSLQQLRHPDGPPRKIWADAICINQADNKEKQSQVKIMDAIYRACEQVLIWLGPSDENSKIAMDYIHKFHTALNSPSIPSLEDFMVSWEWSEGEVVAYGEFIQRPWFQRIWIVQEVSLGRKVKMICGNQEVEIMAFFGANGCWASLLHHSPLITTNARRAVPFITGLSENWIAHKWRPEGLYQNTKRLTLLDNLERHRLWKATKQRDKVFALIGISSDCQPGPVVVNIDYESSIASVYKQTAVAILPHSNGLRLLNLASTRSFPAFNTSENTDIPSWVPDWRDGLPSSQFESITRIDILSDFGGPTNKFKACGDSAPSIGFTADYNNLHVRGLFLDELLIVGDHALEVPGESQQTVVGLAPIMAEIVLEWEKLLKHIEGDMYYGGESLQKAFRQTICCGSPLLEDIETTEEIMALLDMSGLPKNTSLMNKEHLFKAVSSYWIRRFAIASKGWFVLAPLTARKGDRCVIISGGNTPFIVREKGQNWELIGECYIRGAMQGEAFKDESCVNIVLV
jgi:hypothetical protein